MRADAVKLLAMKIQVLSAQPLARFADMNSACYLDQEVWVSTFAKSLELGNILWGIEHPKPCEEPVVVCDVDIEM
jgi:hypothetical protein